jgi:LsmAD domain
MYGVTSDYDENIYTTTIDKGNPLYQKRAAEAERIAREIESGVASNPHQAEERGQVHNDDSGLDEEDKYSGVRRGPADFPPLQSGPNVYTPPARRPPTGQATVKGAPVDPAIISSKIADPKPSTANVSGDDIKSNSASSPATGTVKSVNTKRLGDQSQPSPTPETSTNASKSPSTATSNVENETLTAFKQFKNSEMMRIQDKRRAKVNIDKEQKINDLKAFSKQFKLQTPLPEDLVSILARDKEKQQELIEKAKKNAADTVTPTSRPSSGNSSTTPTTTKQPRPFPNARYESNGSNPTQPSAERQNQPRNRPQHPNQQYSFQSQSMRGQPQNIPINNMNFPRQQQGPPLLSSRLTNIHALNKIGQPLSGVPTPTGPQEGRLPPTGPAINTSDVPGGPRGATTPLSSTSIKFNAKAMEFKPNPSAASFTPKSGPSSAAPSPRPSAPVTPALKGPSKAPFTGKKHIQSAERPSLDNSFNSIKRARKQADKKDQVSREQRGLSATANAYIPLLPAYSTPATWDPLPEVKDKSYVDLFDTASFAAKGITSPHARHAQPPAHQHQLPFHLQQGSQGGPPHMNQAGPHHLHPQQPHHHNGPVQHFDDHHRMHPSISSPPSVLPSPHLGNANLAYQSPMPQPAQLMYQQQMPHYGVSPGRPPFGMGPFPGGQPQFVPHQGGQVGAPMMAHNPSGGPYMGIPQGMPYGQQMPQMQMQQMYSPSQGHSYPQHGGPPQGPGSSGYPSPGRGAPMMVQQGSQQGQGPQGGMMMMGMSPGQHGQNIFQQQQGQSKYNTACTK